jgi:hypothetical protein
LLKEEKTWSRKSRAKNFELGALKMELKSKS